MRYASLAAVIILFAALPTYAQFDALGGPDLSILMSPEHPVPNSTVHLSVKSTLMDLSASAITWYVNGNITVHGVGVTDTDVKIGSIGSHADISVAATGAEGSASSNASIRPSEMDVLWESDSYVPPFYRGRAFPSVGTRVRFEALPRFKDTDGSVVSSNNIIFTWKNNGAILQSLSGRGKSTATIDVPLLDKTPSVTVDAATPDNSSSASATIDVPVGEPILMLYEDHPLFGFMYHDAFGSQASIPGSEATFDAVPFFAQARTPADSLLYAWRINGQPVANNPLAPDELTINAKGSSGQALIELALTHATNYFTNAVGSWKLSFGNAGGSKVNDISIQNNPFVTPTQ